MADKEEIKERKRMIVEEVKEPTTTTPQILPEAAKVSSTVLEEEDKSGEKSIIDENVAPVPTQPKKSSSLALWIIIPLIFILGAILGGVVFYLKGVNKGQEESNTPTPEASIATPAPLASPSATIDLTKYSITVFNGSGIAGEAGKVKDLLTSAGFTVGSTGNAATYDYTKTIIKAKTTVDADFLTQLSMTLSKNYVLDSNQTLATSSAVDVQVFVGSSKAQ
ncbi:MAG: LytR C-terminal domain-containing protein [Candidatus Microgenomates bacterium]|jgi:hypothetical protein